MSLFVPGESKGLVPINTVSIGNQVAMVFSMPDENFFIELYLTALLPVPDMTALVNLAIRAAEEKGFFNLSVSESFIDIGGERQTLDVSYVRW